MKLKNKVVWITGASSGIGRALVSEAVKHGCKIVLSSRKLADLKKIQTAESLTSENSLLVPMDLEKYRDFKKLVSQVVKKFGMIDVLINNAGISQRSKSYETDLSVYEKLIRVNYLGNIALTLAVLPLMRAKKSGIISTVSSVAGKFGTPMRSGYSASKFALAGFYDALRAENYDHNIQVTLLCPGFVQTNISLNALTASGKPQGKMDAGQENGITAEQCAREIFQALNAGKREVYISAFKEKLAVYVSRYFPGLFARIVRKAKVT